MSSSRFTKITNTTLSHIFIPLFLLILKCHCGVFHIATHILQISFFKSNSKIYFCICQLHISWLHNDMDTLSASLAPLWGESIINGCLSTTKKRSLLFSILLAWMSCLKVKLPMISHLTIIWRQYHVFICIIFCIWLIDLCPISHSPVMDRLSNSAPLPSGNALKSETVCQFPTKAAPREREFEHQYSNDSICFFGDTNLVLFSQGTIQFWTWWCNTYLLLNSCARNEMVVKDYNCLSCVSQDTVLIVFIYTLMNCEFWINRI